MALPSPASPRALIADLRNFWRNRSRGQWIAALLAACVTGGIFVALFVDSWTRSPSGPEIQFIASWPASRTDAEIRAKQATDERERRAAQAAHQREMQQLDQSLNRLGL